MASRNQATPHAIGSPARAAAAVLLLAVVVRVAALTDFETTPAAAHPMVDAYTYWQQAMSLFKGSDPFSEGYYQPPAYPWLLSKFMGLLSEPNLGAVRRLQAVLGVWSTCGVMVLGHRLGTHLKRPWLAPLAGLFFVLSPTPLLFEHDVLTPAITVATSTWAGVLVVWAWRRASVGLAFAGGLLGGVACAVHPTYLLAGLTGVIALTGVAGARRQWGLPAALALGLMVPLAPTTVHNAQRFGVVELVSHNGGLNFYLGNNPRMRETAFLRPGLPFRKLVLEAEPAKRTLPERNAYWWSRTVSEARASPMATLAVVGTKALWSVNHVELPRNEDYRCRTAAGQPLAWVAALPGGFGLLFPLAVVGAVAMFRKRDETIWLIPLWLSLHAPLVVFLVSDRYRVASWPVIALLAGVGALVLVTKRDRWVVGAAVVSACLAFVPIDARTAWDPAWCRYQAANLAYMDKDIDGAKAGYAAVVAHTGWEDDMGAHYWLGRIAEREKRWLEAIEHLDVVLRQFPDHFPTLLARADAAYYAGRKSECADHLLRAYRVPGTRTSTGVKLVKLLRRLGRDDEARALMDADPSLAAHPKLQ